MERLAREGLSRVTLDYDGSVSGTGRHAGGTAVGFNRKRKGARSYHPLFRTIAQTNGNVSSYVWRYGGTDNDLSRRIAPQALTPDRRIPEVRH